MQFSRTAKYYMFNYQGLMKKSLQKAIIFLDVRNTANMVFFTPQTGVLLPRN